MLYCFYFILKLFFCSISKLYAVGVSMPALFSDCLLILPKQISKLNSHLRSSSCRATLLIISHNNRIGNKFNFAGLFIENWKPFCRWQHTSPVNTIPYQRKWTWIYLWVIGLFSLCTSFSVYIFLLNSALLHLIFFH